MKRLLPLLLLGLSACDIIPQLLGTAAGPATGAAGAQNADSPPPPASTSTNTSTSSASTPPAATSTANKSSTIDPTRKLESVNIWVDLGDPYGQRALAPYLMKPEEWMLIKCEMLSPTSKHYTFQRVTTADGRSLPQMDLFKQGR